MTSSGVEIIPYLEENNNEVLEKLKKYNYRNFIIPKVIMEIYPKMKYKDYNNYCADIKEKINMKTIVMVLFYNIH